MDLKEAILYEKLKDKKVKCGVCRHRCVIAEGKHGYCGTRLNKAGTLYTLIYNRVSSIHTDPIEKKPLFHFYPGSICMSLGTLGCNFRCPGCQNWEISHAFVDEKVAGTQQLTPQASIDLSLRHNCKGISWTYNEPTIWLEYTLDGARLAKEKGLYTVYVTNGYITPEALELMSPYLDAFRVDIKGFSSQAYKKISSVDALEGVLDSTKLAKHKYGMHVECVTNVTPTINDDEDELKNMAKWICKELGPETPWHVTRFYPYLDLSHLSTTPISKLEKVRKIGIESGLYYVYMGNIPGHEGENTYCHKCGHLLIKRDGFLITKFDLKAKKCPKCGTEVALRM